ncbi:flagellar basal-body MS-ring/collar protein FliF [Inhella gelatinilytica]|uniref:Flagellar M-ring protein n=1 Tax=Inhella gelatinilytica TaxID=2795030 RepID=A0A931IY39_9BURK|nr:flagellar basal-body MS-ring/collar protein FliF [Inhella gelatinilytica]MBH9552748.1 flagellar M-ring protein FliF [Inhella gelatinilytica]
METTLAPTAATPVALGTEPGFADRLKALPRRNQLGLFLGLLLLVAVIALLGTRTGTADYRPLFTGLSDKDGGAVIAQLAQMQVNYRSEPGGTILVPASQVYDLRMKLASNGLPKGSLVGFELLDKPSIGQTQFNERLNFQRALEGELTRTITALADVADARVHLAIPQQTGFFREQQKPSASVMLHVRGGRNLDRNQIAGIIHLVSASVPELNPKAVSVLDQTGKLLSNNEDGQGALGMDAQQMLYKQNLEHSLATRIQALLEPLVGRENFRTTVTADIDFSQSEQTSEAYAPNQGNTAQQTLRSHVVNESQNTNVQPPTGVPGASSNQPPVQATAPVTGASGPLQAAQQGGSGNTSSRRDETRNYEVDKTVKVTRLATGTVKRLTAAVVLNHRSKTDAKGKTTTEALPQAEMDRITALVREAVGFVEQRGDSLQVVSSPFVQPKVETVDTPLWQQPIVREAIGFGAVPAALVLVALIIVFGMVRPALRAAYPPPVEVEGPTAKPGATLSEVVGEQAVLPAPVEAMPRLETPLDQTKLQRARAMAKDNPLAVANIVRAWINGEEPTI